MKKKKKKKKALEFPPFSEMLKRIKLPPRTSDVEASGEARSRALTDAIERESAKIEEEEEEGG